MAGCYVVIKEDGADGRITFKVEDGAMVFAPGLKGRGITAEGVVALMAPGQGPKAAECHGGNGDCGEEEGGCGGCADGEKRAPAPPRPSARLNGVGALVK
jgi:hypothetical protein